MTYYLLPYITTLVGLNIILPFREPVTYDIENPYISYHCIVWIFTLLDNQLLVTSMNLEGIYY